MLYNYYTLSSSYKSLEHMLFLIETYRFYILVYIVDLINFIFVIVLYVELNRFI